MAETEPLADRMLRANEAFNKHVIDGRSLRDIGPELGVSAETVRTDVAAFRQYLASERTSDLNERRAVFEAHLDDVWRKAMYVFEKYKDSKPLVAIGALNSAIASMTHKRAVQGLDAPKEAKITEDITYVVKWGEEDADPVYAAKGLPAKDY